MAHIKDIKLRTEGIRKILKVTSAMQIVAATKLKRAEQAVFAGRAYLGEIDKILHRISLEDGRFIGAAFTKEASLKNICVVAIFSDRGLCGGFNSAVLKKIEELSLTSESKLILIGKKGSTYFRRKKVDFVSDFLHLGEKSLDDLTNELTSYLLTDFNKGQISRVYVVYSSFRQRSLGKPIVRQLLPVVAPDIDEGNSKVTESVGKEPLYLYEPNIEELAAVAIREYLSVRLRGAILESHAAEEMARMLAMKYATDNGNELLDELMLQYHKLRQANITKEIIEVVGAGV